MLIVELAFTRGAFSNFTSSKRFAISLKTNEVLNS